MVQDNDSMTTSVWEAFFKWMTLTLQHCPRASHIQQITAESCDQETFQPNSFCNGLWSTRASWRKEVRHTKNGQLTVAIDNKSFDKILKSANVLCRDKNTRFFQQDNAFWYLGHECKGLYQFTWWLGLLWLSKCRDMNNIEKIWRYETAFKQNNRKIYYFFKTSGLYNKSLHLRSCHRYFCNARTQGLRENRVTRPSHVWHQTVTDLQRICKKGISYGINNIQASLVKYRLLRSVLCNHIKIFNEIYKILTFT